MSTPRFVLLFLAGFVIGCHTFDTSEMSKKRLRDRWALFRDSVNWDIDKELRGETPDAGKKTWSEYWIWAADLQRDWPDGGRRHRVYIVEQRRKAGLPEIPELLQ